jgi:hypothetical protein
MKRKVRITESQLNDIIKKALKEQEKPEDDQFMTGVDQEKMAGGPEDSEEGGEPNFEAFLSSAQELMGQGITIGALVDKLCEAKESESEPEAEPEVEPQGVPQTEPDANMSESKKRKK